MPNVTLFPVTVVIWHLHSHLSPYASLPIYSYTEAQFLRVIVANSYLYKKTALIRKLIIQIVHILF